MGKREFRAGLLSVHFRKQHRAGGDEAAAVLQAGKPFLIAEAVRLMHVNAAETGRHRMHAVGRAGGGHERETCVEQCVILAERVIHPFLLIASGVASWRLEKAGGL